MTLEERNSFVEENVCFVHHRIHNLDSKAIYDKDYYNDLFQAGVLGFIEGLDKFIPEKGVGELTYCAYWIDARIKEFKRKNRTIIIPGDKYYKVLRYKHLHEEELLQDIEIKERLSLTGKEINILSTASKLLFTNPDGGQNVLDVNRNHDPEFVIQQKETKSKLDVLLKTLSQEDEELIKALFGYGVEKRSAAEIGREHGFERQNIQAKKMRILAQLRKNSKKLALV